MNKLYNLVKLKNTLLSKSDSLNLDNEIDNKIEILKAIIEENKTVSDISQIDTLINVFDDLIIKNKKISNAVDTVIANINQLISDQTEILFLNDTYREKFNNEEYVPSHYESIVESDDRLKSWIESKITGYSNWHYPSLQINPTSKKWIDLMVTSDPLYLTYTTHRDLLSEIINDYPSLYRSRLRLYEIKDRNFSILPKNQFGFVLSWNKFYYLRYEKIEKYLREIFQLLRTGGVFMFSYNNCDLEMSALKAENQEESYVSAEQLKKLVIDIGYEIITLTDYKTTDAYHTHVSWIEIKKPGSLTTVKASQAIAQILPK